MTLIYANALQASQARISFCFFSIQAFYTGPEMAAKSVSMIRVSLAMIMASASKTFDFARASSTSKSSKFKINKALVGYLFLFVPPPFPLGDCLFLLEHQLTQGVLKRQ
jgi:hypothetical protein